MKLRDQVKLIYSFASPCSFDFKYLLEIPRLTLGLGTKPMMHVESEKMK